MFNPRYNTACLRSTCHQIYKLGKLHHTSICCLILACGAVLWMPVGSSAYDRNDRMLKLCQDGEFDQVVKTYERDRDNLSEDGQANYLGGYAYLRVHKFDDAKAPLTNAVSLGFDGY